MKLGTKNLYAGEVCEIQRARYVLKLTIFYMERSALFRKIQSIDTSYRNVHHREIVYRDIGESLLETIDSRVFDPNGLDVVQTEEGVARYQWYSSDVG